jgi:hypothetical protein
MLRSKIPPFRLARASKRTQYVLAETFVLLFGFAAAMVIEASHGVMLWSVVVPCISGCLASFALMLTTRCETCGEPLGREGKRLIAVPHSHCSKCGRSVS